MVLAREQALALPVRLAELIPDGVVVRGTVLQVSGEPGAGSTTVAFELAAAVTSVGEWAAAVDLDGSLGALAANEAGVELERFAVVRRVPPARWTTVVAALLDGVSLVIAEVPRGVGLGDARRLIARARERRSVLVVYEARGALAGGGRAQVVGRRQRGRASEATWPFSRIVACTWRSKVEESRPALAAVSSRAG